MAPKNLDLQITVDVKNPHLLPLRRDTPKREAWIYVDESQSPELEGCDAGKPFRVGVLEVEQPIAETLTQGALDKLAVDPDREEIDSRTLTRGWFHSSKDSKNARSPLCEEFHKHVKAALFRDERWHFDDVESGSHRGARLHSLLVQLALTSIKGQWYHSVHVIVARRRGSFDVDAEHWLADLRGEEFLSVLRQPRLPCPFPKVDIELVDGSHPGIQVCDFLLWAVQRAALDGMVTTGDTTWYSRLGLTPFRASTLGPQRSTVYRIGTSPSYQLVATGGRPLEELTTVNDWLAAIGEIEGHVVACFKRLPTAPTLVHLSAELEQAIVILRNANVAPREIRMVLEAFVLVCDTVPIYDHTDDVQVGRATELRAIAAESLARSDVKMFQLYHYWALLRQRAIAQRKVAGTP